MAKTLQQLWAEHDEALDKLTLQQQRRLLVEVRANRREVLRAIEQSSVDVRNHQALLLRLNPLYVRLTQRLGAVLDEGEGRALDLGFDHSSALWRQRGLGPIESFGAFEIRMAARLADYRALALHTASAESYSASVARDVQQALVAGVLQRDSERQIGTRIRQNAPISAHRADLIARMETNRAYNQVASEWAAELGGGWTRRIVEFRDNQNHPFSRAAHGKTAKPGRAFRVPVSEVRAAEALLKRRSRGIFWRNTGKHYVGRHLPAHYGERGRIVPWFEGVQQ